MVIYQIDVVIVRFEHAYLKPLLITSRRRMYAILVQPSTGMAFESHTILQCWCPGEAQSLAGRLLCDGITEEDELFHGAEELGKKCWMMKQARTGTKH